MSVIQTHNKGAEGIPNVYVDVDGNLQFKAVLSDPQEFSVAPGGEVKIGSINDFGEYQQVLIEPTGQITSSTRPDGASSFDAITGSLILGTNAGGSSTRSFSAGKLGINVFSDNDVGNLYGLSGTAVKQGLGDVNKMYGLYFLGRAYSGGKTSVLKGAHIETNLFNGAESDELYGVHSYVNLTGATAKKIAGVYSQLDMLNTSGIEEYYGLLIVQTDVAASVRSRAIYSLSSEPSTFNGKIGVGASTNSNDPVADLHIRSSGSTKSLQIGENSSGFAIYNPDFFGVKYWYANPFGSFFPATAHAFDCGTMTTGGKLIVVRNNGLDKAWIDADGYLHCKGVINI
jgi:hypothetical protein